MSGRYDPAMAISWSDAVADIDDSDDLQRYRRAVSQVLDLEPLVLSFADAVRRAGKWPQVSVSDFSNELADGRLATRVSHSERHIWIYPGGVWGIEIGRSVPDIKGYLVKKEPGEEPQFGFSGGATATIAAEDFGARMDAMDQTKDWIPRELVGYLRAQDIPVPN